MDKNKIESNEPIAQCHAAIKELPLPGFHVLFYTICAKEREHLRQVSMPQAHSFELEVTKRGRRNTFFSQICGTITKERTKIRKRLIFFL